MSKIQIKTSSMNISTQNSGSNLNPATKRPAESEDTTNDTDSTEQKKAFSGFNKLLKKDLESSQKKKAGPNISIKLGEATKATKPTKVGKAALAFSQDDDDDEEEMPPEAKMRMKNIGRDTPTSSGPNSFGKSRMGFCDSKKMYERKLKDIQDHQPE